MSEFRVTIRTENAAFEDGNYEIARILRDIADQIEVTESRVRHAVSVMDINGNRVGQFKHY